ncbi:hypothetical protein [Comamonas antarctica]|uniref:hypothetical protein n=1 Tax=Comamonas antarctica TaxID=2743470 RepID=UPI0028EE1D41|nr:hypothetical protein [Comamonas antarctica]
MNFFSISGMCLLSRVLAAVLGGYLLASALGVFIGTAFAAGADSVLAGVQLGFVIYVGAVIWAFSPVPLRQVWAGLLLPAAALLAAAALLQRAGA